jgi:glycosyltransferase involved in cell wall biosynthesis
MNNSARISLIMPVYNAERYVAAAIDSIIDQTLLPDEFIIVDDASTDETANILQRYTTRYRFIRIITLPAKKAGERRTALALNTALNEAHHEYIAWMDADDVCLPERLEFQFQFLQQHPDVVACGTQAIAFHNAWYKPVKKLQLPTDDERLKLFCLRQSPFFQSSVMMHKSFLHAHALHYNEQYEYAEDYEFFSRVARLGKVANLPQYLLRYRMHGTQSIRNQAFESYILKTIEQNVKHLFGECSNELIVLLNHRSTKGVEELLRCAETAQALQQELRTKKSFSPDTIETFVGYTINKKVTAALYQHPAWLTDIRKQQPQMLQILSSFQRLRLQLKKFLPEKN